VSVLLWIGTGFALFSSPNMNTIMSAVDKKSIGLASGTAASMRVLGQIISMTIITLFFAAYFEGKQIEMVEDRVFLKVMQWGFLCFSFLCVTGVYFSVFRGSIKRN
jgi:phosphotransferase system  glucose/maltose/N-acetylglucosamine-specific IIC component